MRGEVRAVRTRPRKAHHTPHEFFKLDSKRGENSPVSEAFTALKQVTVLVTVPGHD